ncbi:MAG TPA: helix-turn-helix domain-containing protein [Sinorhizobium sp.]|nr:helix-turn-helix domain-containing protein [Sinorhizobium sp.]
MRNFELTRQRRHYGAVRERLVRAGEGGGRSIAMAELEAEVAGLASDNAAKARRIAVLETDLADAEARLLAQAQILLSGRSADETDDGPGDDRPSIDAIVASVLADFPDVTWEDIISVRRERRLVKPRHACMRAVYESRKDLSLPRIGRIFRRDHTTVLAAVKAAPARRPLSSD